MKKYKVIALSVGGLGNKIFNAGDIVLESNFIPGRADELVKQGFLEPQPNTDNKSGENNMNPEGDKDGNEPTTDLGKVNRGPITDNKSGKFKKRN